MSGLSIVSQSWERYEYECHIRHDKFGNWLVPIASEAFNWTAENIKAMRELERRSKP
jgi:hypothetical protein